MADNDLDPRVKELISEQLFTAYWASVDHYGTTDLVLFLDTDDDVDPLRVFVRERLLADPEAPEVLTRKVTKPAKDAAVQLKGSSTAFWLVASFPNAEMVITAVVAERMGAGGVA